MSRNISTYPAVPVDPNQPERAGPKILNYVPFFIDPQTMAPLAPQKRGRGEPYLCGVFEESPLASGSAYRFTQPFQAVLTAC
jgi:hypothetical protein